MLRYLRSLDGYELVDVSEISARLRVSTTVVNNITYKTGTSFPRPLDGRGKRRLWRWCDVLEWYLLHRVVRGRTDSHLPRLENRYRNQNRAYRRA